MKKILIIQTAFIGDVILATVIIEKLAEFYPEAKIDFLLRRGNEGLLKNHPKLNDVFIWKKKVNKVASLIRLIYLVRSKNYDAVINVQRFFASGLITALSGARLKVGFRKNPLALFFTKKIGHRLIGQHETGRNLALVKDLTDNKYVRPKLYPNLEDEAKVAKYQGLPYLCFAPKSVWNTKEFPAVKWVEVIFAQEENWIIYLSGGPDDFDHCEEIREMSGRTNVINLCGKLSFLESAVLMKKAAMNYVNDSAPLHICSSVDAPCNAVFCSTVPSFGFGPLGTGSKVVESRENLACRPCGVHGRKACPLNHFNCAHTIQKDDFDLPIYKEYESVETATKT